MPDERRGPLHRALVDDAGSPRFRHGTDVLLLFVGALAVVLATWAGARGTAVEVSFGRFLAALPDGIGDVVVLIAPLLLAWAIVLVGLLVVARRWDVARDALVSVVVAGGLSLVLARLVEGSWVAPADAVGGLGGPWFPPLVLGLPAAIAVVLAPHLVVPFRLVGRVLVVGSATGLLLALEAAPSAVAAALAVAGGAGALVHLVFGTSRGTPTAESVVRDLARLGVAARQVQPAERQAAGAFVVRAEADDGTPLLVKIRGRDAHDTELVRTAWRTVWLRDWSTRAALGRTRQAEHEALASLLAARAGVAVPEVVAVGALANRDAVVVFAGAPVVMADADPGWEPSMVDAAWAIVDRLHAAGIGHGQLDDGAFAMLGDDLGVVDFSGAEVAASSYRRRVDEAQCFVTLALGLGVDTAVARTVTVLGPERIAAFLPYVQTGALTAGQRADVDRTALDLDAARDALADGAGIAATEIERLRRVSLRSAMRTGLLVLAFWVVASAIVGLDFEALWNQLRDATWGLIVVGMVVAQTPRFSQAASTLGASPIALPYGWVYALQLSISYLGLAAPSSAARVAVNIRFFQRQGLGAGAALTVGALDSVVGIGVQVLVVLGITLFGGSLDLPIDFDTSAGQDSDRLIGFIALIVVVAIVALLASGRRRASIRRWFGELTRDAKETLRGGWTPTRGALLLGGNLGAELLFAAALTVFVRAFGYDVPFVEVLLINTGVSLVAGVLPVPGGIGVVEGGLALGLTFAGVPEEAAFAIAIVHRVATFYLPPIWGYVAFRSLERNGQL